MLVTEQLGIITRFNPGIRLSDEDVKQIEAVNWYSLDLVPNCRVD